MTHALVGLAMAFAAVAPDLSWILDAELQSRAELARTEAKTAGARAAQADADRAELTARRDAARNERNGITPTLDTLSRVKRGLAESRLAELDALIAGWETRIESLDRQAKAARAEAEIRHATAAAVDGEAALRRRQDADAVPVDGERMSLLSDARLRAARDYHARRIARVPAQLDAVERMARDPATGSAPRAALVEQMAEIRAGRDGDAAKIALLDEELRFRAESRDDEGRQAADLERAARAKAAENERGPVLVLSTARSAELDVALERIIAGEDEAARNAKRRARTMKLVVRWTVGTGVLAAVGGVLWLVAFRGSSPGSGDRRTW